MDVAADVGEQKWTLATHFFRIVFHDFQACTDIRSQINLVDDEKIGPCNARAAFPRNLIALSDIDNKDRGVHKLRTERSGEVVTAALDKEKLDVRASRFIEASSRIAVCGQPPVSTPMMRSTGRTLFFARNCASSFV